MIKSTLDYFIRFFFFVFLIRNTTIFSYFFPLTRTVLKLRYKRILQTDQPENRGIYIQEKWKEREVEKKKNGVNKEERCMKGRRH